MQIQYSRAGNQGPVNVLAMFQAQACERLVHAYAPFGGVMSGEQLVSLLADDIPQPISRVAHWIVDGRLIHFTAHGSTCIPRFQLEGCEVRPLLRQTLAELSGLYDAFELAEWFVTPNAWVEDRLPAALVLAGDHDVLDAARADRYLASGS